MAKAEVLGERRRQEAETAAKRMEALEAHISRLEEAVAKAEALGEQRRQEAQTAAKRADDLLAELVEMTSDQISKRMADNSNGDPSRMPEPSMDELMNSIRRTIQQDTKRKQIGQSAEPRIVDRIVRKLGVACGSQGRPP